MIRSRILGRLLRACRVDLDPHHCAAPLPKHPGHVPGGWAELQNASVVADQADDPGVRALRVEIDLEVVANPGVVHRSPSFVNWVGFPDAHVAATANRERPLRGTMV